MQFLLEEVGGVRLELEALARELESVQALELQLAVEEGKAAGLAAFEGR